MLHFLCECVIQNPSVSDILGVLNRLSVCTGTQCFETTDAMVPMHAPTAPTLGAAPAVFMLLLLAAMALGPPRMTRKN